MSDNSPAPATPAAPASNAAPTTAASSSAPAAQGGKAGTQPVTSFSTVGSLGDLKAEAPQVYNAMMQGIAYSVISDMQKGQDRLKKMMRDAERDAGQH